jgi:hypothetical protein
VRLFGGIDPDGSNETIAEAALRVGDGLSVLRQKPRSLAELRADDEDYQWLCTWAQNLRRPVVKRWLSSGGSLAAERLAGRMTSREAIGLLLLLLSAEVARREVSGRRLWSTILPKLNPEMNRLLIDQESPSLAFKWSMEEAARRMSLRHGFGVEGVQHYYYLTVYLQFGLTYRSLRRLPEYLVGFPPPIGVEWLLGSRLQSDSFRNLWSALIAFRRGFLPEAKVRRILVEIPWVLPSWADEIVRRAKGRVEGAPPVDGTGEEHPFLGEPRMRWRPPAPPEFACEVLAPVVMDLSAPHYDIMVGRSPVVTLYRQPDDSYRFERELILPATRPAHAVTLRDDRDDLVASMAVECWSPGEDLVLWEASSGRRLDPWVAVMHRSRSYWLMASADLLLSPEPTEWISLAGGSMRLYLLPIQWSSNLTVSLEGELFWTPHTQVSGIGGEPGWTRALNVYPAVTQAQVGHKLALTFSELPPDVRVQFIRLNRMPLDFDQIGPQLTVTPVPFTPDLADADLAIRIGLRQGEEHTLITRTVRVPFNGAACLTEEGWQWMDGFDVLTVRHAREGHFRMFRHPPAPTDERGAVVEGETFSTLWKGRTGSFGSLAGLGAPLELRNSPYNPIQRPIVIARAVVDPGIIDGIEWEDGRVRIRLDRPIEPGPRHQVIFWAPGDKPDLVSGDQVVKIGPLTWEVANDADPDATVVAIAFDGARLGAWWPDNFGSVLAATRVSRGEPALELAQMIRWLRLPVLRSRWWPQVKARLRRSRVEALAAWLPAAQPPYGLTWSDSGEAWLSVLRSFCRDLVPQTEEAQLFKQFMAADGRGRPEAQVLETLMRIDPVLMIRTAMLYRDASQEPETLLHEACCMVAGLHSEVPSVVIRQEKEQLLLEAAQDMAVDPGFIEAGLCLKLERLFNCQAALDLLTKANLAVALSVDPLRRYLALHFLIAMGEKRL